MKLTITQGHSQGRNNLTPEVDRLLSQMRTSLCDIWKPTRTVTATVGNNVATAVWTSPAVPPGTCVSVTANVIGDGLPSTVCRFIIDCTLIKVGSAAAHIAWATVTTLVSVAPGGQTCTFAMLGELLQVVVTDSTFATSWTVNVEVRAGGGVA